MIGWSLSGESGSPDYLGLNPNRLESTGWKEAFGLTRANAECTSEVFTPELSERQSRGWRPIPDTLRLVYTPLLR